MQVFKSQRPGICSSLKEGNIVNLRLWGYIHLEEQRVNLFPEVRKKTEKSSYGVQGEFNQKFYHVYSVILFSQGRLTWCENGKSTYF